MPLSSSSSSLSSTSSHRPLLNNKTPLSRILTFFKSLITALRRLITSYKGNNITTNATYAAYRYTSRTRFILLNQSVDFALFHREADVPADLRVYRVRKGWRAGLFGWRGAKWLARGDRKGWVDVTPTTTRVYRNGAYVDPTDDTNPVTLGTIVDAVTDFDGALEDYLADGGGGGNVEGPYTHVTHVCVHNPLTTGDGVYRYVVTDGSGTPLIATPEYTLHASWMGGWGLLRGSSLGWMPVQLVGWMVKHAVAGLASGVLTAAWAVGLPGGIAARIFAFYFRREIKDAKQRAWAMAQQKGAVKPLDFVAKAAGGALPGAKKRFTQYEKEWDGKKGSWMVLNVDRNVYRNL